MLSIGSLVVGLELHGFAEAPAMPNRSDVAVVMGAENCDGDSRGVTVWDAVRRLRAAARFAYFLLTGPF